MTRREYQTWRMSALNSAAQSAESTNTILFRMKKAIQGIADAIGPHPTPVKVNGHKTTHNGIGK